MTDVCSAIARAILYEGYVLWPYRRSALKNRQRWTFGGVYPPAFAAASGGVDRAVVRAQCVAEIREEGRLEVCARFLHVASRRVLRATPNGLEAIDELSVDDRRVLSWEEAIEREARVSLVVGSHGASVTSRIEVSSGSAREDVCDRGAALVGAIERSWEALTGSISAETEPIASGVTRVTVCLTNDSSWTGLEREAAARRTFVSAHVALQMERGAFVSQLDPPPLLADAVAGCRSDGLWPVLVGGEGSRDEMLASPIILYDYPRIAPESPGDLFDGGEIDQLLILNVLSLTDAEKEEMRATDPRVGEILDRCASLSTDELSALHGAIRSLRPTSAAEATS